MAERVKVTGFNIKEKVLEKGNTRLGFFDAELPGMMLYGCSLVRIRQGSYKVYMPHTFGPKGHRTGIVIFDRDLRREVEERALAAFAALSANGKSEEGGEDGK